MRPPDPPPLATLGQLIRKPSRAKFTAKLRIFGIVGNGLEVSNVSSRRCSFFFFPPSSSSSSSSSSACSFFLVFSRISSYFLTLVASASSIVSATHLSVASAPYVLVLHGLTRWHSLS